MPPDSLLNAGASVKVKTASLGPDWLPGTVVRSASAPACLAIRLERTDSAGRNLYVFLAAVTALAVDLRTNQGTPAVGLTPPTSDDWRELSAEDVARLTAACKRQ